MQTTTPIRLGPNDTIVWPRAELRMIADSVTLPFIAETIRRCLETHGGMKVLAIRACSWKRQAASPHVRRLAATIQDYAKSADALQEADNA